MRFVLVPDEIQLDAPEPDGNPEERGLLRGVIGRVYKHLSRGEDMKSSSTSQPPGFPLLAACKQACAEARRRRFTYREVAVENICRCFSEIHVGNRSRMQIGTLTFGLPDLTLTDFESIERHMKLLMGSRLLVKPGTASREQGSAWVSDETRKTRLANEAHWTQAVWFKSRKLPPCITFAAIIIGKTTKKFRADGETQQGANSAR
ncbi:hypothetical protein HO173_009978 [Letharia columbiana]|uniref:Uncharacterized protein n=1 Tax=Letharia columbiana TaxID=112416 RepID=A0A8H6FNQ3_9LECA|nr:uncharacterized protein HO173_009978 [Letharia columbiana]KAF6231895.1 hypothetical protein HO173_009978 [Letharia columbiana]